MDQFRLAELRLAGSHHRLIDFILCHLLKLWHLDENLMNLFLGESVENVWPCSMVELLLGHALFLEILKVTDTVLWITNISLECILQTLRSFRLGVLQESFGSIESHLRLSTGCAPALFESIIPLIGVVITSCWSQLVIRIEQDTRVGLVNIELLLTSIHEVIVEALRVTLLDACRVPTMLGSDLSHGRLQSISILIWVQSGVNIARRRKLMLDISATAVEAMGCDGRRRERACASMLKSLAFSATVLLTIASRFKIMPGSATFTSEPVPAVQSP